jgi:hypothetical protein
MPRPNTQQSRPRPGERRQVQPVKLQASGGQASSIPSAFLVVHPYINDVFRYIYQHSSGQCGTNVRRFVAHVAPAHMPRFPALPSTLHSSSCCRATHSHINALPAGLDVQQPAAVFSATVPAQQERQHPQAALHGNTQQQTGCGALRRGPRTHARTHAHTQFTLCSAHVLADTHRLKHISECNPIHTGCTMQQ